MSCVFLVTPVVIASWPIFCAAASVAAASLGFKTLKGIEVTGKISEGVELDLEGSEVLTDQVKEDEELIFGKDDFQVRVYKDTRGRCAIHVKGEGRSKEELQAEGTALVNKIKQQYAYQKVTQELKDKGFSITEEEVTEEGRIKIHLRKFD